jgi:hypothetical protein
MKRSNQQPMASIAAARAAVIIAVAAGVAAIVACPAGAGAQVQGTYRMYSAGIHEYNDDYSIEAGVVRDEITGVGFSYSREVEMTPGALEGELMSEGARLRRSRLRLDAQYLSRQLPQGENVRE